MNKIQIEKILRGYKTKKSIVENTNATIQAWEEAKLNPELIASWRYSIESRELGMPGSATRNTSSPIEREICDNELTIEELNNWIKDYKSKIYRLSIEVNIIEGSLNALTVQEKYVTELKYFEKLNWKDIEINFNQKCRQKNYITESGIRKINEQAIDKLNETLTPFSDVILKSA